MPRSKEEKKGEADAKFSDSELWGLPAVDAKTIEVLDKCGVHTYELAAILPFSEAVTEQGLTDDKYVNVVKQANDKLNSTLTFESRAVREREFVHSGSVKLDEMLRGGYLCGEITELCAPFSCGKTNMVYTAIREAYKQYKTPSIYVHTELQQPFSDERFNEVMVEGGVNNFDKDKNLVYIPVANTNQQEWVIMNADKFIKESKCRLLVEDSLMSHFRAEFRGRGMLAERQQKVGLHLKRMARLAYAFNISVLITNHLTADPSAGGNQIPSGGAMLHYNVGKILLMRWTSGKGTGSNYPAKSVKDEGVREVTVLKAVDLPVDSRIIKVGKAGLMDE